MSLATLAELQARVQSYVLHHDEAAMADLVSVIPGSGARGLGIYHHAYRARLLETLRDSFGHTLMYLGDEWFDALSAEFIEAHPSASANLRWYGAAYPAWLAQRLHQAEDLGDHPEVAELARLDWALRAAFDGPDAPALALAEVAALAPEAWAAAVFKPHPTLALLSLQCNTLSLWQALDQDAELPAAEALPSAVEVAVWRFDERPHFRSTSPMEATALQAVLQGLSFAETCALLAERFPDEDAAVLAGGFLRRWIEDGLLASVS